MVLARGRHLPCPLGPANAAVSCISMPTDHDVATAPLERHLLPRSASVDERGHLHVGGIDLLELVEQFGTPLFVYDEAHLRQACREAVAAWGDGVAYATKAFLCRAMARLADEEGMHLDVASGGEQHVALSAGVSPTADSARQQQVGRRAGDRARHQGSAASSSTPSTKSPAWAPFWTQAPLEGSGPRSWSG